jgi:hypothetical protein
MAQPVPAHPATPQTKRHRGGETTSWIIGVILIVLGIAFLLEQYGVLSLTGNWWAIFIYLAGGASLANAWRVYRARQAFDSAATSSLIWGLVLFVVATIFAFNLAWDLWWPVILVAIGAGIVVGYLLRGSDADGDEPGPE